MTTWSWLLFAAAMMLLPMTDIQQAHGFGLLSKSQSMPSGMARRLYTSSSPTSTSSWLSSQPENGDGNPLIKEDTLDSLTEKLQALLTKIEDDKRNGSSRNDSNTEHSKLSLFRTRLPPDMLFLNRTKLGPSTLPNAGRGLFATRDIEKGELLTGYPGDALVLVPDDEADNDDDDNDDDTTRSDSTTTTSRGVWAITWGDHVDVDLLVEDYGDVQNVLPDKLLAYMIHAMGNYGILALPTDAYSSDPCYLGHLANDGATHVPFTMEEVAPYIIESSENANAVHKDLCGCHMVMVATKNIAMGEEIFVVYGPGYWMDVNGIDEEDEDDDDY